MRYNIHNAITLLTKNALVTVFVLIQASISTTASAKSVEAHNLYRHKHWAVDYVTDDRGRFCRLYSTGRAIAFAVNFYAHGTVTLQVHDSDHSYDGWEGKISIYIDNFRGWDVDAVGDGNSIFTYLSGEGRAEERLLNSIQQGNNLYVVDIGKSKQDYSYRFSLAGSKASSHAFMDCIRKL